MNLILTYCLLFIFNIPSSLACEEPSYLSMKKLQEEGFTVMKIYKADGRFKQRSVFEYTAILSSNIPYQIVLIEKYNRGQFKVSILNTKRELIASNDSSGVLTKRLNFQCPTTHIYYIRYEWIKQPACGAAALGYGEFDFQPQHTYSIQASFYHSYDNKGNLWGISTKDGELMVQHCWEGKTWDEVYMLTGKSTKELLQEIEQRCQKKNAKLTLRQVVFEESPTSNVTLKDCKVIKKTDIWRN